MNRRQSTEIRCDIPKWTMTDGDIMLTFLDADVMFLDLMFATSHCPIRRSEMDLGDDDGRIELMKMNQACSHSNSFPYSFWYDGRIE